MRAYIVTATETGKTRNVARQIASLPGVKMDACWGSRDVFAAAEVRSSGTSCGRLFSTLSSVQFCVHATAAMHL